MLFAQDDECSCATESVATVGLQTWHPAETTLPVLTPGDRGNRNTPWFMEKWRHQTVFNNSIIDRCGGGLYLRIQLVVSSNSFGVRMFVSDATEAAQYALLRKRKKHRRGWAGSLFFLHLHLIFQSTVFLDCQQTKYKHPFVIMYNLLGFRIPLLSTDCNALRMNNL